MTTYGPNPLELVVPQRDAAEATVMIWHSGAGLGALDHAGHASVLLRRQDNQGPWVWARTYYDNDADIRYVSFWPTGDARKNTQVGIYTTARRGDFQRDHLDDYREEMAERTRDAINAGTIPQNGLRPGQVVLGTDRNGDDVWGQRYQALIHLPALSPSRMTRLGLDLRAIVDWAIAFKNSPAFNYVYISKTQNCAGVAVEALAAGGAEVFADQVGGVPKVSIYFTPNDAERWAKTVELGIDKVNTMLTWLQQLSGHVDLGNRVGLPAVADWKKASDVGTFRGGITRSVDSALADFHKAKARKDFLKTLDALVRLIVRTHEHLARASARNAAYLELARQIVWEVGELAREAGKPWSSSSFTGKGRALDKGGQVAAPVTQTRGYGNYGRGYGGRQG
jgi:hypothetical protein